MYWKKAIADGWVPGKTLFSLEEAAERGTVIQFLISDAGQMAQWPNIKPYLEKGDALYFSHGFSIVYKKQTGVVPQKNIDVILVARSGENLRILAQNLASQYSVRAIPIPMDLSTIVGPGEVMRQLAAVDLDVDLLVNNAGINILQPFMEVTQDSWDR